MNSSQSTYMTLFFFFLLGSPIGYSMRMKTRIHRGLERLYGTASIYERRTNFVSYSGINLIKWRLKNWQNKSIICRKCYFLHVSEKNIQP